MTRILENRVSPGSIVADYFRARSMRPPERIAAEWRREIIRRVKTARRRGQCARLRRIRSAKREQLDRRFRLARSIHGVCSICKQWRCVGSSKTCVLCTYCN